MTNPCDDPDGTFLVLVNEEGQHSLWPAFAAVPAGWTAAHERDTRQACLDDVEAHWADMHSHGLTSTLLSNIAVRTGEIVESILARRAAPRLAPPRPVAAALP